MSGSLTDVPGLRVGHAQRTDDGWCTGTTVVLPPPGTVGAVDVRGGGPATRETDALHAASLVPTVDAVVLTGGSAFGLAAADGVMAWCEETGRGFPTPGGIVPIVPAAALYDLARGGARRDAQGTPTHPDAAMGRAAAQDAAARDAGHEIPRGRVGAGTGARVMGATRPGGLGTASVGLPAREGAADGDGAVVGALVAVNAHGTPVTVDPADLCEPASTTGVLGDAPSTPGAPAPGTNTTLAVIATDLALTVAQAEAICRAAHAGMARALDPVHSLVDGDLVFGLATGDRPLPTDPMAAATVLLQAQQAAATALTHAIEDGVSRHHG